jgi:NADH:ubiquinone oxidoreductase subunit E
MQTGTTNLQEVQKTDLLKCDHQLTDDELLERLDAIIGSFKDVQGALIPILQTCQNLAGYLPEKALKHISLRMKIPYSEVSGVVTFYSFFSTVPRGKYLVRVCLGTACYVRGGKKVLESITSHLGIDVGKTTEDRLFSLEVGRCFGACGLAPVIMVNETVHQRVKPSRVAEIFNAYRQLEENLKGGEK